MQPISINVALVSFAVAFLMSWIASNFLLFRRPCSCCQRTLARIYYINLDDRQDRNKLFNKINRSFIARVPTERWPGVKFEREGLNKRKLAEIGCSMAHESVLRHISKQDDEVQGIQAWYLVMEDDAKIPSDFDATATLCSRPFVDKHAGVVQLSAGLACTYPLARIERIRSWFLPAEISNGFRYRTGAYIIRPGAALDLADHIARGGHDKPVDEWWQKLRANFKVYGICMIRQGDASVTKSSIVV